MRQELNLKHVIWPFDDTGVIQLCIIGPIGICTRGLEKSLETPLIRQSVNVLCYIMHSAPNKPDGYKHGALLSGCDGLAAAASTSLVIVSVSCTLRSNFYYEFDRELRHRPSTRPSSSPNRSCLVRSCFVDYADVSRPEEGVFT